MKQKKGLTRNTVDKYYTIQSIVDLCIDYIKLYLNISPDDLIIEPSAGNGMFINKIKTLSCNHKFYDIIPEHSDIVEQDYLELDYSMFKDNKMIHIIGNPPFGRQSSIAIKFIKKSCEYCNTISFILPKSFKKNSMKEHFNNMFHLKFEIDLPYKSFTVNGVEHDVPCIFQIWEKKDKPRDKIKKILPINFKFVNKMDNPHISFRRIGVNAGTISKNIQDKSEQSHYFISFDNMTLNTNIEKLQNIIFSHNNTVGPKSISKPELINEFNKLLINC